MRESSRTIALECLFGVEFDDAYGNLLLPRLLKESRLDERDSALAQELAFGTIRWQLFYDRIIEECAKRYSDEIDLQTLIVIRLGVHQLLAMRIPAHAALDETVELAKQFVSRGAAGFVNGVLRRVSEKPRDEWVKQVLSGLDNEYERLAVEYSHPIWVVKALEQALKLDGREKELRDLLLADNIAPLVSLVALPGIATPSDVAGLDVGPASPIGFQLEGGDPNNLPSFRAGALRVQDQGSQLAALALTHASAVAPGERWLDMCAGPGGKAALLAAEAKLNSAELVCNEISEHRSELVKKALVSINSKIKTLTSDARELPELHGAAFDRILLDAPCTGLGALRRRPEARWRKQQSDVAELSKLQEQLLDAAWKCLKPGGVLAYVTCSPHIAETNSMVDWAKRKLDGLDILNANEVLKRLSPALELSPSRKTAQLWPHIHQTDAMFIALLHKSVG
jgi:16S rRNA (cytosine967-C5)-methyltransferase